MIGLSEEFSSQKEQNKQILILNQSFNKNVIIFIFVFWKFRIIKKNKKKRK